RQPDVADDFVFERTDDGKESARRVRRRLRFELAYQRRELARGLLFRDARPKPCDQIDFPLCGVFEFPPYGLRRPPEVHSPRVVEVGRHHADDAKAVIAPETAPDDIS